MRVRTQHCETQRVHASDEQPAGDAGRVRGGGGAGARGFAELRARLTSDDPGITETLIAALRIVLAQIDKLTPTIAALEDKIKAVVKGDADMRRLARIPGVGFLTAHAVAVMAQAAKTARIIWAVLASGKEHAPRAATV